jgi:hypothetical protein
MFFTTEVWTSRGLVTFYTVFTMALHSRRVQILGSTPHPNKTFMLQIVRHSTGANESVLDKPRVFLCDRDRKWSTAVRQMLDASGVRVIQTPFCAPNCNAHAGPARTRICSTDAAPWWASQLLLSRGGAGWPQESC